MRITKTANDVIKLKIQKRIANIGCDICPCCGETKNLAEYSKEGIHDKGVMCCTEITWAEGIFKMTSMKCDCYKCYSCGTEWQSEPYQWC